jgi:hypothetical protein
MIRNCCRLLLAAGLAAATASPTAAAPLGFDAEPA